MLKLILNIETIATIGDSYNDISMLDNADDFVTFFTSPEDVKYCVDSVAEAINIFRNKNSTATIFVAVEFIF